MSFRYFQFFNQMRNNLSSVLTTSLRTNDGCIWKRPHQHVSSSLVLEVFVDWGLVRHKPRRIVDLRHCSVSSRDDQLTAIQLCHFIPQVTFAVHPIEMQPAPQQNDWHSARQPALGVDVIGCLLALMHDGRQSRHFFLRVLGVKVQTESDNPLP